MEETSFSDHCACVDENPEEIKTSFLTTHYEFKIDDYKMSYELSDDEDDPSAVRPILPLEEEIPMLEERWNRQNRVLSIKQAIKEAKKEKPIDIEKREVLVEIHYGKPNLALVSLDSQERGSRKI